MPDAETESAMPHVRHENNPAMTKMKRSLILTILLVLSLTQPAAAAPKGSHRPRPLDPNPVTRPLSPPLPPGKAHAFLQAQTGGDQMSSGPGRQPGLQLVVHVGDREIRQLFASCPDYGLGSALGGGTERELEMAVCGRHDYVLISEPGRVRVARLAARPKPSAPLDGETVVKIDLPSGVRSTPPPAR
jgi:hypothetical protein